MSLQATCYLLLGLLQLTLAHRLVFEPFVELTEEVPRTQKEELYRPALDRPRVSSAGLGFGGACTHDAQCADGLICTRNEQRGVSQCLCSQARPIYVHHAGIGKCVRAKSLYESCVSNAECNRDNPNVECVDFLCYCPLPFVLTEDRRCLAPPGYGHVAAVVTPVIMLSLTAVLGIAYLYHRVYRDSWVPAEPHVVAVPSTATIPQAPMTPTQPKPRYIRGLTVVTGPPASPQAPRQEHRSDGSDHTGSPSSGPATPKRAATPSPASPRCASTGDAHQKGGVTVAVCKGVTIRTLAPEQLGAV
ncbi:uncharacterized protein LOC142586847 [Dermacentor variabilis]|uniref:uncharacterized protein LOC142586847 n=1 Tax=Dermacentor variabilis TaxID=34621 RepID=UPI003F5BBA51